MADVGAVYEYASLLGVVESEEKLEQCGLAKAVLPFEAGDAAKGCREAIVAKHPTTFFLLLAGVGIVEPHVMELDLLDLGGKGHGIDRGKDVWFELEEVEQIADEKLVLVEAADARHET